jgi:Glycosyl hydrolase family 12/Cellulose binding domain
MKARRLLAALGVAAAAITGTIVAQAGPAAADTTICEQYGNTTIQGGAYYVQNNRWGTTSPQCISVNNNGFRITQQDGVASTNGAPTAYPSTLWGCHYTLCTPGFSPIQASSSAFNSVSTSVSMSYVNGGNWDAAYDIWFDPTPRTDGQNTGAEIMVWLNHSGPPQPVGSKVGTVSLAGGTWDVWEGNIGWNVISYVRTSGTGSISFPVSTFYNDAVNRGYAQRSWYLTSIQAGFEPWSGGAGLAVTSFSVTRNGTPPVTTTTTRPPVTTTTGGQPSGGGGCSATASINNSWSGGFTADVTVRNTGSSAIRGWTVRWTFPSGQTITSIWNATSSASGSSVTATNASYNGALGGGASTSFGFQGSGSAVAPSLTCTAS